MFHQQKTNKKKSKNIKKKNTIQASTHLHSNTQNKTNQLQIQFRNTQSVCKIDTFPIARVHNRELAKQTEPPTTNAYNKPAKHLTQNKSEIWTDC